MVCWTVPSVWRNPRWSGCSVVVALVIAAIAAAFGVILTARTAVMAAGALLLAAGFVFSLVNRFSQAELADTNPLAIIGLALMDTVGVTGIIRV